MLTCPGPRELSQGLHLGAEGAVLSTGQPGSQAWAGGWAQVRPTEMVLPALLRADRTRLTAIFNKLWKLTHFFDGNIVSTSQIDLFLASSHCFEFADPFWRLILLHCFFCHSSLKNRLTYWVFKRLRYFLIIIILLLLSDQDRSSGRLQDRAGRGADEVGQVRGLLRYITSRAAGILVQHQLHIQEIFLGKFYIFFTS